jgi:hypothetical protein
MVCTDELSSCVVVLCTTDIYFVVLFYALMNFATCEMHFATGSMIEWCTFMMDL